MPTDIAKVIQILARRIEAAVLLERTVSQMAAIGERLDDLLAVSSDDEMMETFSPTACWMSGASTG